MQDEEKTAVFLAMFHLAYPCPRASIVNPVAHLAAMIAAFGRSRTGGRFMAWAYFDETLVKDGDPSGSLLLVGGCIASPKSWERFSQEWAQALHDEEIKVFHAADFYAFQKPFNWYTRDGERDYDRHNAFSNRLADLIIHHVDEAVAFTSPIIVKKGKVRVAYAHGVLLALNDASKLRGDDPLCVILARHPELSKWSILRCFEQFDWDNRLCGCGIFDPKDVPALQAADFVMHSVNRSWGAASAATEKRLGEGLGKRGKQFRVQLGTSWNPDDALLKTLAV